SPMGFRLPLDSLGWVVPSDYPYVRERDPMEESPPLPQRHRMVRGPQPTGIVEQKLEPGQSAPWIVRTALCTEARHGKMHIFMPPMQFAEDYLDLVQAVEDTASDLKMPVLIEGYTPPNDHRIEHIKVTPDPGVIEVNMHPAGNWDEMVSRTTTLYDEA